VTVVALDSARPVLGGSTIAAAAGIDPWCSRGELPEPEGEQLEWGRRVQPLIFEALRERIVYAVETPGVELVDERWPWLVGHPDGVSHNDTIVEAKLTGGHGYRKGGGLPLNWQAQVQTYMRLGDVDRALVAVLVSGIRLDVHEVVRDDRATDLLFELAEGFVHLLRSGEVPSPDGSESAREALALRFPRQEPGKTYRLTGFEWETAKNLRLLREQRDEVERQITELENRVKVACPEAETLIDPYDNTFATWKEVTQRRLDGKALAERQPELHAAYTRETSYRRFNVV
jgi:predicted phage-related endonuclease